MRLETVINHPLADEREYSILEFEKSENICADQIFLSTAHCIKITCNFLLCLLSLVAYLNIKILRSNAQRSIPCDRLFESDNNIERKKTAGF